MNVKLVWATPDGDSLIGYMARVSNPANQNNPSISGLIKYMAQNHHWSPFEMVSACLEIETTRDIGRQILRHRSFSFQELSQRYQDVGVLPPAELRECRIQDAKNRQNSIAVGEDDQWLADSWSDVQKACMASTKEAYEWALSKGIAKEQARALLPEGLTSSRMYMSGTLRSWLHYIQVRTDPSTQKEHRLIALLAQDLLTEAFPITFQAIKE